jgi:hypothetical protein
MGTQRPADRRSGAGSAEMTVSAVSGTPRLHYHAYTPAMHAAATREASGLAPRPGVAQEKRAGRTGLAPSPGKPEATVMRGTGIICRPIAAGDRGRTHYRQHRP